MKRLQNYCCWWLKSLVQFWGKNMEVFLSLLWCYTVVITSLHHQYLCSHTSATMVPVSPCHVVPHCYVPTFLPPFPAKTTTPLPPCTAWGRVRVRTCRLPLIWVIVIQFSGCYKPAQCPTTPFPISLMFHGHKMCLQPPPCGDKGTRTHIPLVPHRYP